MTNRDDVQAYLDRLDLPVESVAEDMWLVRTAEDAELIVHYAPPVLVLRVRVMQLPSDSVRGPASSAVACSSSTRGSWCTARTASRAITSS